MTPFEHDFMTKAQVDGVRELIDLCRNGYQVVFGATVYTARQYKLKHSRNGRTLMVSICRYSYSIKENGKVLKLVAYNEDGTIIQPES